MIRIIKVPTPNKFIRKRVLIPTNKVSVSLIEKEFKISKKNATEIIKQLEEHGVVSPLNGRKREVLISKEEKNNFELL